MPIKVGKKIVVQPSWEEYTPQSGEMVIQLDPGMAFGTGTHESTKMCIQLLEDYVRPDMLVADVGCGSGILSIAAALLGAKQVLAFDRDLVSVESTRENARRNAAQDRITAEQSDLLKQAGSFEADLIVSNILADIIIRLNGQVKPYLKEDGIYLMSGIIDTRLDDVLKSLAECDFQVIKICAMGEWRAVAAKRNA